MKANKLLGTQNRRVCAIATQILWICAIAIITLAMVGCGGNDDPPPPETFTVKFDANGGSPTPPDQTVEKGKTAAAPTGVTKTGYDLIGWYKEEALTNKWNFASDTVTASITLFAKWNETTQKPADTTMSIAFGENIYSLTIKSDDQFTSNEWSTLCVQVVTAFETAYTDAPKFGKGIMERMCGDGITIVLEKNPTDYTNYKVGGATLRTLYLNVESIDFVNYVNIFDAMESNNPEHENIKG